MSNQTTSCVLQTDKSLKEQQAELNAAARKKIISAKREVAAMELEWKHRLEKKMGEIKTREELKLYDKIKHKGFKRPCYDKLNYCFAPDCYFSVVKKHEFALQCIKEIRADAEASGDILPWRECIPNGIMSCVPLKAYIDSWIAEEP